MLRAKLAESGWKDQLKTHCKGRQTDECVAVSLSTYVNMPTTTTTMTSLQHSYRRDQGQAVVEYQCGGARCRDNAVCAMYVSGVVVVVVANLWLLLILLDFGNTVNTVTSY